MKYNEKKIITLLNNIFKEVFDDDTLIIEREYSAIDIDGWDSLAQIRLIMSIESCFNISLDFEEVSELSNIGEMIDLISSILVNEK